MQRDFLRAVRFFAAIFCTLTITAALPAEDPPIDFAAEVQPILAQHCYQCHGPDAATRQADLRLDQRGSALEHVVPGKPRDSELYRRLVSSDPDFRMPPLNAEHQPTLAEIGTLRRWIELDALWEDLWSLQPIKKTDLPEVRQADWPANAIDFFTLSKMEANGLAPAEPASRHQWLRRVTFDLTGLPPTPKEIERYLADDSPKAESKVIQRLLASPAYGEHFAREWLDLGRYADTHGYSIDSHRDMWRYREWVIEALNENMPFDQFTIEQLAGDLLPDPTIDQLTATGFHRNTPVNDENGAFDEEYRHAYVVDRVNTTGTVWLGMTLACAQCHDHKYDPISQRDFYQMAAYFDNVDEKGLDGSLGNAVPVIKSPTKAQRRRLAELKADREQAQAAIAGMLADEYVNMPAWEDTARREGRAALVEESQLLAKCGFDQLPIDSDVISLEGEAILVPGKVEQALLGNGNLHLALKRKKPGVISLSAWLYPTIDRPQTLYAAQLADGSNVELNQTGGEFELVQTSPQGDVRRWHAKTTQWETNLWQHVAVTIDPAGPADSAIWVRGKRLVLEPETEDEEASVEAVRDPPTPSETLLAARGLIDQVRIDGRRWSDEEVAVLAGGNPIAQLLAIPPRQRSAEETSRLKRYYLQETEAEFIRLEKVVADRGYQIERLEAEYPETMVMRERTNPRTSHIRERGAWDQLGEVVDPMVPTQLFSAAAKGKNDRLQLAQWLVHEKNPLTARVIVNRYWAHYFGTGLVKTVEDFGTRGDLPSHPELLDYLASDLIASGWDLKRLQNLIVSSNTYRQSSHVGEEAYREDPDNRLLARGPRLRLSAEEIRDQALAASGLLVRTIGGPSVKPYQPPGLWEEISSGPQFSAQSYDQEHGERLYRRSLYTYWKRSSPPPNMLAFDAPNRETCVAQRSRTNTPMQALVLLNDVTFVEAAKVLASEVLRNQSFERDPAIEEAFLRVVSRPITREELTLLVQLHRRELARFAREEHAVKDLLSEGETHVEPSPELAAMTVVCHTILNLDEAVTTP
ncbi:DUF1553 domain-containing protein [Bremerella sp. JC817]|uniref:DUF1553 domain-containing protein n=1 Tax=Bremerella sp. JC817 TaxID=3231756 RepID=UPI00345A5938